MHALIGYVGAMLLMGCGLPLLRKTMKDRHARGVSFWFLVMWGFGELLMAIYVWPTGDAALIWNYALNAVIVAIVLVYRVIGGGE